MPVVFRHDGLRYFFFCNEGNPREPPHVHVHAAGKDAKVWLVPDVALADGKGFNAKELRRILDVIESHKDELVRA